MCTWLHRHTPVGGGADHLREQTSSSASKKVDKLEELVSSVSASRWQSRDMSVTSSGQSRSEMTRQWSMRLIPCNPANRARIWSRKWDTHAVFGEGKKKRKKKRKKKQKKKRAQVVKTPERPSAPASPPPCGSSRRTMARVSPGTKCSLCPPERSRLFFFF